MGNCISSIPSCLSCLGSGCNWGIQRNGSVVCFDGTFVGKLIRVIMFPADDLCPSDPTTTNPTTTIPINPTASPSGLLNFSSTTMWLVGSLVVIVCVLIVVAYHYRTRIGSGFQRLWVQSGLRQWFCPRGRHWLLREDLDGASEEEVIHMERTSQVFTPAWRRDWTPARLVATSFTEPASAVSMQTLDTIIDDSEAGSVNGDAAAPPPRRSKRDRAPVQRLNL